MTTERDKLNAEVNRLLHEQIKLNNEAIYRARRNKLFDVLAMLAIIAAAVAVTKLFL